MFLTSEQGNGINEFYMLNSLFLYYYSKMHYSSFFLKRKRQPRPYNFLSFDQPISKLLSLISKGLNYYLSLDFIDNIIL